MLDSQETKIYSGSMDGTIRTWDFKSGQLLQRWDVGSVVYCLDLDPLGSMMTAGLADSLVHQSLVPRPTVTTATTPVSKSGESEVNKDNEDQISTPASATSTSSIGGTKTVISLVSDDSGKKYDRKQQFTEHCSWPTVKYNPNIHKQIQVKGDDTGTSRGWLIAGNTQGKLFVFRSSDSEKIGEINEAEAVLCVEISRCGGYLVSIPQCLYIQNAVIRFRD
jgi:WD40 repeat protein